MNNLGVINKRNKSELFNNRCMIILIIIVLIRERHYKNKIRRNVKYSTQI